MPAGSFLLLGTPGAGGSSTPPATPTLSQPADNADGTGATATISGSTTGSTNTVYVAPWTGAIDDLVWTSKAVRTGDGSVSLSLSDGFYVARCESVKSGLPAAFGNNPVFQTTGGGTYSSVHKALAEAVKTKIISLLGSAIVGPVSDSVRVRKMPWTNDFSSISPTPSDKSHAYPAIIVCYYDREEIPPSGGTNVRDRIGYPISVAFARPTNAPGTISVEDGDDTFLRWREAVERNLTFLRGFGGHVTVTANGVNYTFHNCLARPGVIFDDRRWTPAGGCIDFGWLTFSFIIWRQGGA